MIEPRASGNYRLGVILAMMAGVCLSSAGLIVRHIESADGWQILFYRSVAFTCTVLTFITWRYRGRILVPFVAIGWRGMLVALALSIGFTCYLFAILMTTVANVVFLLSTAPFFAALLGWFILRERVERTTWLAILLAAGGVGLMFAGDLTAGHLLGNLIAIAAAASFAVMLVTMRSAGTIDMMPATCLAGVIAALLATVMVEGFAISAHDLVLSLLLGSVQVGAGFILITLGARYLPATDVALLALTETVLAPIWVWLFIGETPAPLALLGGAIVLLAVSGQAVHGIYRNRATAAQVITP